MASSKMVRDALQYFQVSFISFKCTFMLLILKYKLTNLLTLYIMVCAKGNVLFFFCGCSSMAEFQLPKLTTRVRFPSSAPVYALIAQSVERFHGKEEVIGSIPIKSSRKTLKL